MVLSAVLERPECGSDHSFLTVLRSATSGVTPVLPSLPSMDRIVSQQRTGTHTEGHGGRLACGSGTALARMGHDNPASTHLFAGKVRTADLPTANQLMRSRVIKWQKRICNDESKQQWSLQPDAEKSLVIHLLLNRCLWKEATLGWANCKRLVA